MTLTKAQKAKLDKLAVGEGVKKVVSAHDQIEAIIEQIDLLTVAAGIGNGPLYLALTNTIKSEKAKRDPKAKTKA